MRAVCLPVCLHWREPPSALSFTSFLVTNCADGVSPRSSPCVLSHSSYAPLASSSCHSGLSGGPGSTTSDGPASYDHRPGTCAARFCDSPRHVRQCSERWGRVRRTRSCSACIRPQMGPRRDRRLRRRRVPPQTLRAHHRPASRRGAGRGRLLLHRPERQGRPGSKLQLRVWKLR
ncbi:hypothetical protein EXIGLDRAFT_299299 [Exidia glandulosa HHB12029]|uniref:Uncharacterized protein n=1 Tax=Exidia glandulosa HHB12029 TaxID=1314781 RepID=A0A165ZMJ2_EXIGL|nr:hypothetical protein EXIGLDRAFT_299299 [Exidia glandulosa HHB12029]